MLRDYNPYYNIGPGDFIKEELEVRGWLQTDLADILGMSKKTINKLINNKQSITIDTAKLLSKAFGQYPQYWINLDTNYRLRLEDNTLLEDDIEVKAKIRNYMPINEMFKKGWIKSVKTTKELKNVVQNFWGIKEVDFTFLDNQFLPNFRKSKAYQKFNQYYALTWFQMAKNCARKYNVDTYNKIKLKSLSLRITKFSNMENGVENFLNELNKTGVKFFVLSHLQKTYTDGASFFDVSNPTIVYTGRYDRIDNFWFTIAHEIGHILLHLNNKEQFFIDESNGIITKEEKEADVFAAKNFKEDEILRFFNRTSMHISKKRIITCSVMLKINEAIIVGVLQHHNKLPITHLNKFKTTVSHYIPVRYFAENLSDI